MIAKFDRVTLQAIRADLDAVLAKYGMTQGLDVALGNIKFSEAEFVAKLNVKIKGAKTQSSTVLESIVKSRGLKMEGVGGRVLVDYKARNFKYPFIFEKDGKRFKCSTEQALTYFKA